MTIGRYGSCHAIEPSAAALVGVVGVALTPSFACGWRRDAADGAGGRLNRNETTAHRKQSSTKSYNIPIE